MARRFAIYVYWDADGVLKAFARHFLSHLRQSCQDVLVVINGDLDDESCNFISAVDCQYIRRANIGYDFGAYQFALQYMGWHRLQRYDEIILCNSSFYGPFYPLHVMFDAIDESVDFWGITAWMGDPWPDHIQSYFYVFRRRISHSEEFRRYWDELQWPKDRAEAIAKCETQLTKVFALQGFRWTTFIPSYVSGDITIVHARESLNRKMPVLKRKYFDEVSINKLEKIQVLALLKDCYDINLIFEDCFYKYSSITDRIKKESLRQRVKKRLPSWVLTFYQLLKQVWRI